MTTDLYKDLKHLRLLRAGFLFNGLLLLLAGILPLADIILTVARNKEPYDGMTDPDLGIPVVFLSLFFIAILVILGIVNLLTSRFIKLHRNWRFCIVITALNTVFSPCGIVLAIFAFMVLLRDSVKQLFDAGVQPMNVNIPDRR